MSRFFFFFFWLGWSADQTSTEANGRTQTPRKSEGFSDGKQTGRASSPVVAQVLWLLGVSVCSGVRLEEVDLSP